MKLEGYLTKILVVQLVIYFLSNVVWIFSEVLSKRSFHFDLVLPLILLIVLAQGIYVLTVRVKTIKFTKIPIVTMALVTLTFALAFGVISRQMLSVAWDMYINISFMALLGIWALSYYFFIIKRRVPKK